MTAPRAARWPFAVALALLVAACGDTSATTTSAQSASTPTPPTSSSATVATSGSAARSAAPAAAFVVDVEVVKLIKAIATGCEVDEARASVRSCKANEDETLGRYVEEKKPDGLYGTAASVALGEGAKDKKLFAAAVNTFNRLPADPAFMKKNATPGAAAEVAKLIPLVLEGMDAYFAQGASAVMLLAGRRAELTSILVGGTARPTVAKQMWTYYLKYGGVDALDDLRGALKSDDAGARYNAAIAPAAALGANNALGEADRAKVCDFAKEVIALDDEATIGAAADSLAQCGGAYSDAALDALAKRTGGPTVSYGVINGAYHQCWAQGVVGGKINGTRAQCEKALDILEKITAIKDLDPGSLSSALWALGYTGKNGGDETFKRSKAILAKFATHKNKSVQEKAKADYTK